MNEQSYWYLVQCKSGESFRAAEHLSNQDYVCFHPTYPVKRKIAGRVQVRTEALFPHYLFVLLNNTNNWAPIRSTRGVNSIVRFNGVPAKLDDHLIHELRAQCDKLHGWVSEPQYKVGQRVLITDTCFKEIEAIVTATNGDERVSLLFHLCNRPQEIVVPTSALSLLE